MIVKKTNKRIYYPKRKIGDLVLSVDYKYSDCHADDEIYFYQAKQAFINELDYEFYFEARNRKTNMLEACLSGYKIKGDDILKYSKIPSMNIDRLSFNNVEALIKLFCYMSNMWALFSSFPSILITDLDYDLKNYLNGLISIYDIHDKYNQKALYISDEAYNLNISFLWINGCDNYKFEDPRTINLDNDFTIESVSFFDDVFNVDTGHGSWAVPAYNFLEEDDGDLAYLNEELPVDSVKFNILRYKNEVVGYFVFDNAIDEIDNRYVPVAYIYDMYIETNNDFKYKILEYMLNYIKLKEFKRLTTNFVLYKLNDGKDSLCNCLIERFNAIDDGDKVYIKYEQK